MGSPAPVGHADRCRCARVIDRGIMSPLTGRNAHATSLVVTVRFCCSDGD